MKNLLFISLLAFGLTPVYAQDTSSTQSTEYKAAPTQDTRPVRLGFLARPALTWLTAENPENAEIDSKGVRMGFAFGFMVDFTIAQNNNYALGTGLMINLADGGRLKYPSSRTTSDTTSIVAQNDVSMNFQWLEVPITLKLKTNQIGYMTYFGQLGLQGGVKLSAKQNGDYYNIEDPEEKLQVISDENINEETRLFNAGLLVGVGAEYNISGNTNIVFGLSYYRGFTNVLKGNVVGLDGNLVPVFGDKMRATLNNISLNLGVIF